MPEKNNNLFSGINDRRCCPCVCLSVCVSRQEEASNELYELANDDTVLSAVSVVPPTQ